MSIAKLLRVLIALTIILASAAPLRAAQLPPAPAATETFTIGSLHVQKYGSGAQTLILIPGLGCGPWVWNGTIAHFAPNYTIYALTLPGFDGNPYTAKPSLFDAFANDFWALLASRTIDRPVLVGHSLGGTLGLYLAEQHADRLRAVAALDGMPVFPPFAAMSSAQRMVVANQAAAETDALTPLQQRTSAIGYMKTVGVLDSALATQTGTLEAKSDPHAFAQWLREDGGNDLRPNLAKITIPLLEISPYNAPDFSQPPMQFSEDQKLQFYRSLLSGAPKAQVVTISPARHFAMLDQPDKFYALLTQFLTTLP
jgi:pimeloyl-ACP methyl ester carboxylesterase